MNIFSNKKKFYLIILIYSLFAISFALYVEYILNYPPCRLCLYQRMPYVIAIFVSFAGYNYFKNNKILILIFMIFLISALVSGYHYGIEKGIFAEFSGCSPNGVDIINKEELLKSLKNNTISCKDVNFQLLGFSLAGINFIFSILIAIYSLRILFYAKR